MRVIHGTVYICSANHSNNSQSKVISTTHTVLYKYLIPTTPALLKLYVCTKAIILLSYISVIVWAITKILYSKVRVRLTPLSQKKVFIEAT